MSDTSAEQIAFRADLDRLIAAIGPARLDVVEADGGEDC